MILANHGIVSSSGASFDADALAFITAASITDNTQKTAVNRLVTDLKTYNIWTKMKAIYPFVGGNATSHKFNLKDARDLDAAYRLFFNGGGTHDANGYKGNGTNAWANTYLNPATVLTQNDIHVSWYSNTNIGGAAQAEIGQVSSTKIIGYAWNGSQDGWVTRLNAASNSSAQATATSIGFHQMSRLASANYIMQKNTTQTTISIASTTPTSQNIILLATTTATEFSSRQLQLVTIGNGLTASEMNDLNTINTNYKTNLGR